MSDIEDVVQQLVELQSQMAFQEDTVTALNEALAGQQQEILVLRKQLALLKERQDEYAATLDDPGAAPANEKPPHY